MKQLWSDDKTLEMAIVEIYLESPIDLLTGLHLHKDHLERQSCWQWQSRPTLSKTLDLFRTKISNRRVGSSEKNRTSSRSHIILMLRRVNNQSASARSSARSSYSSQKSSRQDSGILYLVDLAGSERQTSASMPGKDQVDQAKAINQSLTALGKVVMAFRRQDKFVPYRDSLLTRMLKKCFITNAKALVIAQV